MKKPKALDRKTAELGAISESSILSVAFCKYQQLEGAMKKSVAD